MNRVGVWVATAVLLLAAAFVSNIAPADDAEVAEFVVTGAVGEVVTGRDLAVTVTDAGTAVSLTAADGWRGQGNWLVVDLEAASVTGPGAVQFTGASALMGARFVIDGRSFRASERMPSLLEERLFPGLARQGSLAFELPALTGSGVLQLSLTADVRMDSVLEIPVDLDELMPRDEAEVAPTEWAR